MKKIMVHAYPFLNLGDDLFIKILCERYKDTKFLLQAPKVYREKFKAIPNLSIIPSDALLRRGIRYLCELFKLPNITSKFAARNCDASVLIGGSLFIQDEKWRKGLEERKALQGKGKAFFLLGANFGPFSDPAFLLEHKQLFQQFTDICFREKYSYELFNEIDHVRLGGDIGFLLEKPPEQTREKSLIISVIKPSIRDNLAGDDALYYAKIKEIIIFFIDREYDVTLMSFCEFERDPEAITDIISLLPSTYQKQVARYHYTGDLEEALAFIARASFLVATRFHAVILALVYQIPVFPIAYSEKITNVLEDMGFPGPSIHFEQLTTLRAEDVYKASEVKAFQISQQITLAEKQFKQLDKYLLHEVNS